ncbi:MAG: chromosome condensation regulator RCC1 [Actinobacteria bacterium]|nr:chromosome condensation regulator RCC1 [Actinomycetota bacterium]
MRRLWRLAATTVVTVALLLAIQPAQAASPKLSVSPGVPVRGETFTVSGRLSTKVARPVQLEYKSGKKWKKLASAKTTAKGRFSFTTTTTKSSLTLRVVAKKVKLKVGGKKKTFKKITTKSKRVKTRAPALKAVGVSSGSGHTCALTGAGAAWCWGGNYQGQLGDGTRTDRLTAVKVKGLPGDVVAISAGRLHSCALTRSGTAWCWGLNESGQLGDGTATRRTTAVEVRGLTDLTAISAGGSRTCALDARGATWCWGGAEDPALSDRRIPVRNERLSGVATVDVAEGTHACAITKAGTALCWGQNDKGQIGDGTRIHRVTPVPVTGLSRATSISGGQAHTCALTAAGAVACWGSSQALGNLGREAPGQVPGLTSGVRAVTAGEDHTCALTTAGTVKCWGDNGFDQIGKSDDSLAYLTRPKQIPGLSRVVALSTGGKHNCAVLSGGAIKCWGSGLDGALGDGTHKDRATPVYVKGFEG